MSQKDIPGYAMISGGNDNGKYVDAAGKLYRLSAGSLYEVESGDLAPAGEEVEDNAMTIGEVHAASAPHDNDEPLSRHSETGAEEVLKESVKEEAEPAKQEAAKQEAAPSVGPKSSRKAKPAPEPKKVEPDVVAADLVANYSPAEILSMTRALVKNLDEAGVKHDIEPLEGDDETSVRLNADAIAKYADA
jgi:hypothetical protein